MANCYRTHGLNILSEIELPSLEIVDGQPDVHVRIGKVPEHLKDPVKKNILFEIGGDDMILDLNRFAVGRYYVREGFSFRTGGYRVC